MCMRAPISCVRVHTGLPESCPPSLAQPATACLLLLPPTAPLVLHKGCCHCCGIAPSSILLWLGWCGAEVGGVGE